MASAPAYSFVHTGHLAEPLLVTDAAGAVVSSITRDPWGNAVLLAGTAAIRLGYPGQWHDGTSGLYQNWHRDYDPTLGRYLETDPIGLAGGTNLYAYVDGNPVNLIDPMGLCVEDLCIGEGLAAARLYCLRFPAQCARAAAAVGGAIANLFRGPPRDPPIPPAIPRGPSCEPGEDCEVQWEEDRATCKRAWGFVAQDGLAVCNQTAFARYSECRTKGGPITPLYLPRRTRKGWEY